MSTYPDTLASGRIDIIIFPSGGKEILGRQSSYPELPETAYIGEIQKFVSAKQGLKQPEKFTAYYTCKDDVITLSWTPYAGEIQQEVPAEEVEPEQEGSA